MNKFLIPTILTATVLIAGIFALMPIEKATTVHGTIGASSMILEDTMVLPANGDDVLQTIDCGPNGGVIETFYQVNDDSTSFSTYFIKSLKTTDDGNFADEKFKNDNFEITTADNDNSAYRNMFDRIGGDLDGNGILCPPNGKIVIEYESDEEGNAVTIYTLISSSSPRTGSALHCPRICHPNSRCPIDRRWR